MKINKLTLSALFISLGTLTGHIIYIPVGVSKCFPVQHLINVLSAVLLGPAYAIWNAFAISLLRNLMGVGSLLAFPGSIIGAFLAGYFFKKTGSKSWALLGEVFGTGFLGAIISYPIAKYLIGKDVAVFFFVIPFLISTIGGSIIAYMVLEVLENSYLKEKMLSQE